MKSMKSTKNSQQKQNEKNFHVCRSFGNGDFHNTIEQFNFRRRAHTRTHIQRLMRSRQSQQTNTIQLKINQNYFSFVSFARHCQCDFVGSFSQSKLTFVVDQNELLSMERIKACRAYIRHQT